MIRTSRHPACLMASAVRHISAFVMRTSFMCENVVGPICPALEQFANEIAKLPAHCFRPPLVRLPLFQESDFSSHHFLKRSKTGISDRIEIFLHPMLPRGIRQQDHATHETLELAERESPFDWALCSHGPCGDRGSRRRAPGADARSLLGGNRDSGCDAIHSRRYADALRRAHRCHRRWRVSRSTRIKLLRSESCSLHARDLFHRPTFVWLSLGEDRLSICQCHPDDHCFDSANKSCVDRCPASIH